jgi:hypothetical protein
MSALTVIPPIVDPLGGGWGQPERENILVDDTHAVMSEADFERLAEYSCSIPSGVYPGKMWRRHNGAFDHRFLSDGGFPVWLLCWYAEDDEPDMCAIHNRIVLLVKGGDV